ncbi:hypothetical protein HT031_002949 [Scenedesmus sp. PABB004]|nr:hypothetical protein HT031_002949 [Scenedesmus sp. PABB004]
MGAYKYVEELWRKKQSDVLRFLLRVRCWEYRQLPGIVRLSRPSRPDKARRMGYKAKQGFVVYRVRVRRGGRKRPVHKGQVYGKPVNQGITQLKPNRNHRSMAEERVGRKCGGLRVLNSYWVNQDSTYKYFEVVMVDPMHNAVRNDARANWICNPVHKHRELRGLTSAGKKYRGLRGKGHNYHKAHPSVRATYRKNQAPSRARARASRPQQSFGAMRQRRAPTAACMALWLALLLVMSSSSAMAARGGSAELDDDFLPRLLLEAGEAADAADDPGASPGGSYGAAAAPGGYGGAGAGSRASLVKALLAGPAAAAVAAAGADAAATSRAAAPPGGDGHAAAFAVLGVVAVGAALGGVALHRRQARHRGGDAGSGRGSGSGGGASLPPRSTTVPRALAAAPARPGAAAAAGSGAASAPAQPRAMAPGGGLRYLSGFGAEHSSEALPGALPEGQNNPRVCPYGLYAEQISGTAFTVPRKEQQRSWLYRVRPSVTHEPFHPLNFPAEQLTADFSLGVVTPNQLRWRPLPIPAEPVDFVRGLFSMCGAGSAEQKTGYAIHIYTANTSMTDSCLADADGDMLLVPQQGGLLLTTEFGKLEVSPGQIAVVPRGVRFAVALLDGAARGYVLEVFQGHFTLPDLGPIGANGLASPRHFEYPVAWFDASTAPFTVMHKFQGQLFAATQNFSPFNVVAWHGNYAPYRYDLARFCPVNAVAFDHPDPSIFTVLTVPSPVPGVAVADFVVFPPRWTVAENTFRPPYYHRNVMNEFMGLIRGTYEAKQDGFLPGGASLHLCMTPHGPDTATYEAAIAADTGAPGHVGRDTLAFMFETSLTPRVTPAALGSPCIDRDYYKCWVGLASHFQPDWQSRSSQQQREGREREREQQQQRAGGGGDAQPGDAPAAAAAAAAAAAPARLREPAAALPLPGQMTWEVQLSHGVKKQLIGRLRSIKASVSEPLPGLQRNPASYTDAVINVRIAAEHVFNAPELCNRAARFKRLYACVCANSNWAHHSANSTDYKHYVVNDANQHQLMDTFEALLQQASASPQPRSPNLFSHSRTHVSDLPASQPSRPEPADTLTGPWPAAGPSGRGKASVAAAAAVPPPPPPPRLPDAATVVRRIAAMFDARAAAYDADTSYHAPLAAALLAAAAPRPGEAVLDIACGTGLVALPAAEAVGTGGRVVGVDLSAGMLEQARSKAAAAGVSGWTELVHGDAEDYPALAARWGDGGFDIITCSAAVPFLRDAPAALARWRAWLAPGSGRLAFNTFVAPAVLDYATFIAVAARHGVSVVDPCAALGSAAALRAALAAAGFGRVQVREEPKERVYAAASPAEYAQRMVALGAGANPFCPVDETVLPPEALAALRADALAEIAAGAAARFVPGAGVRSPYTVLHVLAQPACVEPGGTPEMALLSQLTRGIAPVGRSTVRRVAMPGRSCAVGRAPSRASSGARDVRMDASKAKFFVGGNWKCNGTHAMVENLVAELNQGSVPSDIDVVVAPPFIFLDWVRANIKPGYQVAAQNCWVKSDGAFTGEISAEMLVDAGVPWVITGHSERRSLCGESNTFVGQKTGHALDVGLQVIACIGETLDQRNSGNLWHTLDRQMDALFESVSDWGRVVIAYEPVWAIGTGQVATPAQAQEVHAYLRKVMSYKLGADAAERVRIIYGGSVNDGNCNELATQPDIDGFLVGGASLKAGAFLTICGAVESRRAAAACWGADVVKQRLPVELDVAALPPPAAACGEEVAVATVAFSDRESLELFGRLALHALPEWLAVRQAALGRSLLAAAGAHWLLSDQGAAVRLECSGGGPAGLLRLNARKGCVELAVLQDGAAVRHEAVASLALAAKVLRRHAQARVQLDRAVQHAVQGLQPAPACLARLRAQLEASAAGHKGAPHMQPAGVARRSAWLAGGIVAALVDCAAPLALSAAPQRQAAEQQQQQQQQRRRTNDLAPGAGVLQEGLHALADCVCAALRGSREEAEQQAQLFVRCVARSLDGGAAQALVAAGLLRRVLQQMSDGDVRSARPLQQACEDPELLRQLLHCYGLTVPRQRTAGPQSYPLPAPCYGEDGPPSPPLGGSPASGAGPAACFASELGGRARRPLVPRLSLPSCSGPATPASAVRSSRLSQRVTDASGSPSAAGVDAPAAAPGSAVAALQQLGHSCGESAMAADLAAFVTHKQLLGAAAGSSKASRRLLRAAAARDAPAEGQEAPPPAQLELAQLEGLPLELQLQLELLECLDLLVAQLPRAHAPAVSMGSLLLSHLLAPSPLTALQSQASGSDAGLLEAAVRRQRHVALQLVVRSSDPQQRLAGGSDADDTRDACPRLHSSTLAQFKHRLLQLGAVNRPDAATHAEAREALLLLRDLLRLSARPLLADTACAVLGGALAQLEHGLLACRVWLWPWHAVLAMDALVQLHTELVRQARSPAAIGFLLSALGASQPGGATPTSSGGGAGGAPGPCPADGLQLVLDLLQQRLPAGPQCGGAGSGRAREPHPPRGSQAGSRLSAAGQPSCGGGADVAGGAEAAAVKAHCWQLLAELLELAARQPAPWQQRAGGAVQPTPSSVRWREAGSSAASLECSSQGRPSLVLSGRHSGAPALLASAAGSAGQDRLSLVLPSAPSSHRSGWLSAAGGSGALQLSASSGGGACAADGGGELLRLLTELLVRQRGGRAYVVQQLEALDGGLGALPLQLEVCAARARAHARTRARARAPLGGRARRAAEPPRPAPCPAPRRAPRRRQLLRFVAAAFAAPESYALAVPQLAEFYVHHHFLHLTRHWYRLPGAPSAAAAAAAAGHARVLLALARHAGGTNLVRRRFTQLRVLDFLVREAGLEHGLAALTAGFDSSSSSCASTPASSARRGRGGSPPGSARGGGAALLLEAAARPEAAQACAATAGDAELTERGVSGLLRSSLASGLPAAGAPAGAAQPQSRQASPPPVAGRHSSRSSSGGGSSGGSSAAATPTYSRVAARQRRNSRGGEQPVSAVKSAVRLFEAAAAAAAAASPPRPRPPPSAAGLRHARGVHRLVGPPAAAPVALGAPAAAGAASAVQAPLAMRPRPPGGPRPAGPRAAGLDGGGAGAGAAPRVPLLALGGVCGGPGAPAPPAAGQPLASPRSCSSPEPPSSRGSSRAGSPAPRGSRAAQPELTGDASMDAQLIDEWEARTGLTFAFDGLSDAEQQGSWDGEEGGGEEREDEEERGPGGAAAAGAAAVGPARGADAGSGGDAGSGAGSYRPGLDLEEDFQRLMLAEGGDAGSWDASSSGEASDDGGDGWGSPAGSADAALSGARARRGGSDAGGSDDVGDAGSSSDSLGSPRARLGEGWAATAQGAAAAAAGSPPLPAGAKQPGRPLARRALVPHLSLPAGQASPRPPASGKAAPDSCSSRSSAFYSPARRCAAPSLLATATPLVTSRPGLAAAAAAAAAAGGGCARPHGGGAATAPPHARAGDAAPRPLASHQLQQGGAGAAYASHRAGRAMYVDAELHGLCLELALHLLGTPAGMLDPLQLPQEPTGAGRPAPCRGVRAALRACRALTRRRRAADGALQAKVLVLLAHLSHPDNAAVVHALARRAAAAADADGAPTAAPLPPAAAAAAGMGRCALRLLRLLSAGLLAPGRLQLGAMIRKGAFSEVHAATLHVGGAPRAVAVKVLECGEGDSSCFERVYNEARAPRGAAPRPPARPAPHARTRAPPHKRAARRAPPAQVAVLELLRGCPGVVPLLDYGVALGDAPPSPRGASGSGGGALAQPAPRWLLAFPRYRCSLRDWRQARGRGLRPGDARLYLAAFVQARRGRGARCGRQRRARRRAGPVTPAPTPPPAPRARATRWAQVAGVVARLHAAGVVHYDVKGDNVLLDWHGGGDGDGSPGSPRSSSSGGGGGDGSDLPFEAVLADFGDALLLEQGEAGAGGGGRRRRRAQRHRGTELFSSPEMLLLHAGQRRRDHAGHDRRRHRGVGPAHDVWSLGCTLYELLTGRVLFEEQGVGRITSYAGGGSAAGASLATSAMPPRPRAGGRAPAAPSPSLVRAAPGGGVLSAEERAALSGGEGLVELVEFMLVGEPTRRPGAAEVVLRARAVLAAQPARG